MSVALTNGVRVIVRSKYLPEQSMPAQGRYVFAYTVRISNEGRETVQLRTRHWIISDGTGRVQEVRGEGVVGEQPVLRPNQSFEYTSGSILKTPWGTMHGSYQMYREDGSMFDAEIAPFLLSTPTVISPGLN
jgi:ApaG protein